MSRWAYHHDRTLAAVRHVLSRPGSRNSHPTKAATTLAGSPAGTGQTPLMAAIMSGQYEGAAALIAAGARLDLRDSRNWTAADFAQGVPQN